MHHPIKWMNARFFRAKMGICKMHEIMQELYGFTHLWFWALIINGLQRRFYTLPFFRYAATFFNVKNLMKFSYKKCGHIYPVCNISTVTWCSEGENQHKNWKPCITIFDEMCTAIFAGPYISRYYKHEYVLPFVNV